MVIRAILTLALLLPVAARAEDMFRWRDARGRTHYSNDTEKVPAGAKVVTKQLGHIGGEPIGEVIQAPAPSRNEVQSEGPRASFGPEGGCPAALTLAAFPHRAIDFNSYYWFEIDGFCGPQHDIEGWLRRASTQLAERTIGYLGY
jgi:hypothetical protein